MCMINEMNNRIQELEQQVERLQSRDTRWHAAYVKLTNNVEFADNGEGCYVACNGLMREFDTIAGESEAQSLAGIQAHAVSDFCQEMGLFDSAYDDQEYIEVSRSCLREHVENLIAGTKEQQP